MYNNTCCFTGHREIAKFELENIRIKVEKEISELIKWGISNFICGGAIGFDILCGEIVLKLKMNGANVKLILALPCKSQSKYFSATDKERYNELISRADEVIYTSENYFNGCMHKRNRFMVDNSKYIIAYCKKNTGGSYYTREYAKSMGLELIDV